MTARKRRREPATVVNNQPAKRVGGSRLILSFPMACSAALAGLVLLPAVAPGTRLYWSLCGAAGFLAAWSALLASAQMRRPRSLTVEIALRRQHYIQALAQASIFLYWGWHWREVYDSVHLIAAQLLFAYAFDMLLAFSRRDSHTLGFGPFPVVFSINLFLWFKADWFYFQFVLIAAGFAAKELIRWNKGGRRVHIFNPSSLPLGVCSLVLLLTGTSSITWGYEIANTLNYAPHIYLFIFLVSLPGQLLFGVTTMTMSAVVTMYLFGLFYFASTGIYYFFDSYIPIAVFLGMHLLFNDPSTSPRSGLGRILFGVLYALGVIALYAVLDRATIPTFYDKLLAVPVMNLLIQVIDRVAQAQAAETLRPDGTGRRSVPGSAPQPALRRRLGGRVHRHERGAGRRRQPPRPVGAVLAAGLHRRPHVRLPKSGQPGVELLPRPLGLGLQRVRHPDQSAAECGIRHAGVQRCVQPRLRARLRQSRSAGMERAAADAAGRVRLPGHPAGQQGTAAGHDSAGVVQSGLQPGIRGRLPEGRHCGGRGSRTVAAAAPLNLHW